MPGSGEKKRHPSIHPSMATKQVISAVLVLATMVDLVAASDRDGEVHPDSMSVSFGGLSIGVGDGDSCGCLNLCRFNDDVQKCRQECHSYCGTSGWLAWSADIKQEQQ